MKIQSTKLQKGMTIKVDAKSAPIMIESIEETFCKLTGRGPNGKPSLTDYGKVIINGDLRLGKRKKVEVL